MPNESLSVYDYITNQEILFKTQQILIADGWNWNMHEHIRKSTLYKNSKFSEGDNDGLRPFKNIIRPIINVAYRSEGFDVKDIEPFVNDNRFYFKSFLVRKFHNKFARDNDIDTFIDEGVESYVDFGLWLAKNTFQVKPETITLARLAFCDQTDVLSGPICERHELNPDQLKEMEGVWDDEAIKLALKQGDSYKVAPMSQDGPQTQTPGRYIEVFELSGVLPTWWMSKTQGQKDSFNNPLAADEYDGKDSFTKQVQIVTFYKNEQGKKVGIKLFAGPLHYEKYKALMRDKIFGRACGLGGIEELFDPQKWANYSEIKIKAILDAAAIAIGVTDDDGFVDRNPNIGNLKTGEVLKIAENKKLQSFSYNVQNVEKFNAAVDRWQNQARTIGSASDPILGEEANSGTPFKLQELVVQEGMGIHEYRRGKIATFLGEIYRDWILPHLAKEMNKGQKWLDELSLDELNYVADIVIDNEINNEIKKRMLPKKAKDAKLMRPDQIDFLKTTLRENFMKQGGKRFLEIMEGELEDIPMDVYMNIAGKQKQLARNADKLTNIFRQILANPTILQEPGMGKLFNEIIESSGFSPIDFSAFTKKVEQVQKTGQLPNQTTPQAKPSPEVVA